MQIFLLSTVLQINQPKHKKRETVLVSRFDVLKICTKQP